MSGEERVTNFAPAEALVEQVAEREEVAQRLAHLSPLDQQVGGVQPIFHESPAGRLEGGALTLGDFIFVMRKNEVLAAQVQVETGAQELHAHCAALDVPAWTSFAPR